MPVLCFSLPQPRPRLRAVIVSYLAAFRITPGQTTPMAVGRRRGAQLAIEPARPPRAGRSRERAC